MFTIFTARRYLQRVAKRGREGCFGWNREACSPTEGPPVPETTGSTAAPLRLLSGDLCGNTEAFIAGSFPHRPLRSPRAAGAAGSRLRASRVSVHRGAVTAGDRGAGTQRDRILALGKTSHHPFYCRQCWCGLHTSSNRHTKWGTLQQGAGSAKVKIPCSPRSSTAVPEPDCGPAWWDFCFVVSGTFWVFASGRGA